MERNKTKLIAGTTAVLALLALGACGASKSDRALSGGAIGAGAGALGGAAGAATGYFTDDDQINLGKPAWR